MKKTLVILSGILLVANFAIAQANDNYRIRNHKLNPTYAKELKETAYTVPAKTDISRDVYSYMARNNKLNQNLFEASLVLIKPIQDFHYRTMNHKLNNNYPVKKPFTNDTPMTHR
jgi:hypothetical protein